jgi:anthranilate synthase component 1
MIEYISYKNFTKNLKKNKIALSYAIQKNVSNSAVLNLINNVLREKNSFVFESVEKALYRGRYTIIGLDPDKKWEIKNNSIYVNNKKTLNKKPYSYLKNLIQNFNYKFPKKLPSMSLMLMGYFGYDTIRYVEKIPNTTKDDLKIPDVRLSRPQKIIIHDNILKKIYYISCFFKPNIQNSKKIYLKQKNILQKLIAKNVDNSIVNLKQKDHLKIKVKSNISKKTFVKNVLKAKEYIKKGDIFQVVLSQRFEANLMRDPLDIYKKIRITNPSPFLYFINYEDFQIIGSSPEILVRVRDQKVTIRPIAGTRPRGSSKDQDNKYKKDLLNDPKELAEHLMLLDLGRNDVGKVSELNSVKVDNQFSVEKYSHVMHIVSNVTGKFKKNISLLDALFAGFPAGTVSGAPKIRAMEIIDELEKTNRKLYAGGIGYFSTNNNMDTCIALRTALIKEKKVFIQSGAGIVADSKPNLEYQETVNKAKALIQAIS